MHPAGVVREINAAGGGEIYELGQRRFTGEIFHGHGDRCSDRAAQLALVFRSEDGH